MVNACDGGRFEPAPTVNSKKIFLEREWNLFFFVTFNVIISHVFPENFIEIYRVVLIILWFSSSILTIFIWHFLFANKLITSAYNTKHEDKKTK